MAADDPAVHDKPGAAVTVSGNSRLQATLTSCPTGTVNWAGSSASARTGRLAIMANVATASRTPCHLRPPDGDLLPSRLARMPSPPLVLFNRGH
jgi:hypothetical protein